MSTGVAEIDEQHKRIVSKMNELIAAVREGRGVEECEEILLFLKSYIPDHFAREKAIMKRLKYPYIEDHIDEHNAFLEDFVMLASEYKRDGGSVRLARKLQRMLLDWFTSHISSTDKRLGDHIREKLASKKRGKI